MSRYIELGVVTAQTMDEVAAAVGTALAIPLHERDGLNYGGGIYWSNWSPDEPDPLLRLIDNYWPYEDEWQHSPDHDVVFLLRIETAADGFDVDDLVRRLDGGSGEWRLLGDESW